MAKTIQDIIDEARILIQDTEVGSYRNSNEDLMRWFNNGVLEIRRLRPDIFINLYDVDVPTYTTDNLTDNYPYDEQTTTALAYFIAGNNEMKDDEHVETGRAVALVNQFKQLLLTAS